MLYMVIRLPAVRIVLNNYHAGTKLRTVNTVFIQIYYYYVAETRSEISFVSLEENFVANKNVWINGNISAAGKTVPGSLNFSFY